MSSTPTPSGIRWALGRRKLGNGDNDEGNGASDEGVQFGLVRCVLDNLLYTLSLHGFEPFEHGYRTLVPGCALQLRSTSHSQARIGIMYRYPIHNSQVCQLQQFQAPSPTHCPELMSQVPVERRLHPGSLSSSQDLSLCRPLPVADLRGIHGTI